MTITISKWHENPAIDGLSPDDKMRWLLRFLQADVNHLPEEQKIVLGDDLFHATVHPWGRRCRGEPLTAGQVCDLHEQIRQGLQAVLPEQDWFAITHPAAPVKGWKLPPVPIVIARVRAPWESRPAVTRLHPVISDPVVAVLHGVADLLVATDDRLQACPECGTLFVRRRRQECCTEKCAQKRRNRRKAAKPRRTAASLGATSA